MVFHVGWRSLFILFKFAEHFRCLFGRIWINFKDFLSPYSSMHVLWILVLFCVFVVFAVKISYLIFMPIISCVIRRIWGRQKCKFFWTSPVSRKALGKLTLMWFSMIMSEFLLSCNCFSSTRFSVYLFVQCFQDKVQSNCYCYVANYSGMFIYDYINNPNVDFNK